MEGHFTMRGELHEFLDAYAGQLGRAAKRDTPLAEQFQRQEFTGATRGRLIVQSREREDFFRYFHANHRHGAIIAEAAVGGKPVFRDLTQDLSHRLGEGGSRPGKGILGVHPWLSVVLGFVCLVVPVSAAEVARVGDEPIARGDHDRAERHRRPVFLPLRVPFESIVGSATLSRNTLQLNSATTSYYRTNVIFTLGSNSHPATIGAPSLGYFTFNTSDRGKTEHLDLTLSAPGVGVIPSPPSFGLAQRSANGRLQMAVSGNSGQGYIPCPAKTFCAWQAVNVLKPILPSVADAGGKLVAGVAPK